MFCSSFTLRLKSQSHPTKKAVVPVRITALGLNPFILRRPLSAPSHLANSHNSNSTGMNFARAHTRTLNHRRFRNPEIVRALHLLFNK